MLFTFNDTRGLTEHHPDVPRGVDIEDLLRGHGGRLPVPQAAPLLQVLLDHAEVSVLLEVDQPEHGDAASPTRGGIPLAVKSQALASLTHPQ